MNTTTFIPTIVLRKLFQNQIKHIRLLGMPLILDGAEKSKINEGAATTIFILPDLRSRYWYL
jgi:hypothetical protein